MEFERFLRFGFIAGILSIATLPTEASVLLPGIEEDEIVEVSAMSNYSVVKKYMNWDQARALCRSTPGGDLASFESLPEWFSFYAALNRVRPAEASFYMWIGARRRPDDRQKIDWVSGGGVGVTLDHPAWWSSAPYFQPSDKGGAQDCLDAAVTWESAPTDSWWDVGCDKKKWVLCEVAQ